MNKTQIINHIACKLEALVNGVQPVDAPVQIALLATLLRDITRDDDYPIYSSGIAYSNGPISMGNELVSPPSGISMSSSSGR